MALTKVSRGLLTTSIVDNGNATAITIDSSENVGIGVTPEAWNTYTPLQVQLASLSGFTNGDSRLSNNAYYAGGWKYINSIPATQYLMDASNGLHTWSTAASGTADSAITWQERLRIDSAGNVGIGTNNPASLLDVSSTGAVISTVRSTSTSGARQATLRLNVASTGGDDPAGRVQFTYGTGYTVAGSIEMTHTNPAMKFLTGTTEVMRISGSNVGINNPNPAQILSICNPANPNRNGMEIAIGASDTSSNTIQNYNRATGAYTPLNIAGSILTFGVGTAATERMRIDSAGNFIVGSTTAFSSSSFCVDQSGLGQFRRDGTPLNIRRDGSNGDLISFEKDGGTVGSIGVDANVHIAINAASGTGKLKVGSVTRYNWDANQFYPEQDNARDLGFPSLRWDDVYSTGGINTSDRNEKQDIEELSSAEQRVAVACKGLMRKFRWKSAVIDKGDDARIHVGIMAQDLQAAFESEGLDPARYGMWCSNTWTDEETGEEITRMSVRYNELLAFIISAI